MQAVDPYGQSSINLSSAPAAPSLSSPPRLSEHDANQVIQRAADQAAASRAARPAPESIARIARRLQEVAPTSTQKEREAYDRRREEYERAERVDACLRAAKVPERYRRAALNDRNGVPADCAEAYGRAADMLAVALTRPGIYVMCGEPGPGKTHLTYALVNAFCRAGRSAKLVKADDYITDYRSAWKSTAAGAERAFERDHVRPSLLVIDEWQRRRDTNDENLTLLRLIDKRYEECKTTVIVSNHATREEFEQSIDARLADRICDGGGIIVCDWPSVRGRIGRDPAAACVRNETGEQINNN